MSSPNLSPTFVVSTSRCRMVLHLSRMGIAIPVSQVVSQVQNQNSQPDPSGFVWVDLAM